MREGPDRDCGGGPLHGDDASSEEVEGRAEAGGRGLVGDLASRVGRLGGVRDVAVGCDQLACEGRVAGGGSGGVGESDPGGCVQCHSVEGLGVHALHDVDLTGRGPGVRCAEHPEGRPGAASGGHVRYVRDHEGVVEGLVCRDAQCRTAVGGDVGAVDAEVDRGGRGVAAVDREEAGQRAGVGRGQVDEVDEAVCRVWTSEEGETREEVGACEVAGELVGRLDLREGEQGTGQQCDEEQEGSHDVGGGCRFWENAGVLTYGCWMIFPRQALWWRMKCG